MKTRDSLIIGITTLLIAAAFWPRHTDTPAQEWSGPAGTGWAGAQARGMQRWDGSFSNTHVASEYLELRCVRRPFLRTRLAYWPGPEWQGWAEWKTDRVAYVPGYKNSTPKFNPVNITAPWWLELCPIQK